MRKAHCSVTLKHSFAVVLLFAAMTTAAPAQSFTTLFRFNDYNGAYPEGMLVQGFDGSLYGTAALGGDSFAGTVFKITPARKLTTLYSFCSQPNCADGVNPSSRLVLVSNGNFYGTTPYGGANNGGSVYEITSGGTLTTLYSFCSQPNCADGDNPYAALIVAANGNFYGATARGGTNSEGTIYEITSAGKLRTLYSFCSQPNCPDGSLPNALVQATNGKFYGTTYSGGPYNGGTVFEITSAGTLTTLYSFCAQLNCTDGEYPEDALIQAADGNFYGTTYGGGANALLCVMGCGTVFEITSAGQLTTLYNFCSQPNCTEGEHPFAGLIQATDGNFYGTAVQGGSVYAGSVFELTPAGQYTTLYSMCTQGNCRDGDLPYGGLVQGTNGDFYGTVQEGGQYRGPCGGYGCGTIFSLADNLQPFVETLPTSGKAGTTVIVLGNGLTGSTSVTFNGTSSTFTVVSDTEITTTVPPGATTGRVKVTTSSGTLTSNVVFGVRTF